MLDTVPLEILECIASNVMDYNDRVSLVLSCKDFYYNKNLLLKPRTDYFRMAKDCKLIDSIIFWLKDEDKHCVFNIIYDIDTIDRGRFDNIEHFRLYDYKFKDESVERILNAKCEKLKEVLSFRKDLQNFIRIRIDDFLANCV
jgi:hypothetical protein